MSSQINCDFHFAASNCVLQLPYRHDFQATSSLKLFRSIASVFDSTRDAPSTSKRGRDREGAEA